MNRELEGRRVRIFPNKFGKSLTYSYLCRPYDSMYSRETQCSKGYRTDYRGDEFTRRVYGRKWLSGDLDIRPLVYTQGAW